MQRRLILVAALAAFAIAPAGGLAAAPKPVPVNLNGESFGKAPDAKVTLKLGGSLRFVWKEGFHNVLTRKAPAKANRVNTGEAVETHKPVVFKPTKKGKYVLYCEPHEDLGMVLTLTVK